MKKNCWEVKKCQNPESCPAFTEHRLDGTHGGKNAGRCCWVVAGTFGSFEPPGQYAKKNISCDKCDFYQAVKMEEKEDFSLILHLFWRMGRKF